MQRRRCCRLSSTAPPSRTPHRRKANEQKYISPLKKGIISAVFHCTMAADSREERIAQRRTRIQARIAQKLAEGSSGQVALVAQKKEVELRDISIGKAQVAETRSRLRKLVSDGDDTVTSVRVEGDDAENLRRFNTEVARAERRKKLLIEAELSAKRNAAITMKWSALLELDIPMDLLDELRMQKAACEKIVAAKDDLIKEFQFALKGKDEEYVKALKKQANDIDMLLQSMTEQYYEIHQNFEHDLEEIENIFAEERREFLKTNVDGINSMFDSWHKMQTHHGEERQKRVEDQQNRLENIRLHDAEDYTNMKVKLETEIQKLDQQLEEMRATYQLNTEKLEYNFRVLTERDQENNSTITQQKRKINRLQDVLSTLMSKYAQTDKKFRIANQELTDQYRRITDQFKDLQLKFKHFEVSDVKKFEDVWSMKETDVRELLKCVLVADKVIQEQQLGLMWFPPQEELINKAFEDSKRRALTAGKRRVENPNGAIDLADLSRIASERVRQVLTMLVDEAGFLVDTKVQKLLETVDESDGQHLKVSSVLQAMGIQSEDDMKKLASYFIVDDGGGGGEVQYIPSDEAVRCAKAFLQDQLDAQSGVEFKVPSKDPDAEEENRHRKQAERDAWDICATVVSTQTFRVWGALEDHLVR